MIKIMKEAIQSLKIMLFVISVFAFAIGLAWLLVKINSTILYITVPLVLVWAMGYFLLKGLNKL